MSATWSATALIGVKVRGSSLYTTSVHPGCNCFAAVPGAKFCPQCGKPALRSVKQPIAEYDEGKKTVCGLPVVEAEGYWYVAALLLSTTDYRQGEFVNFTETFDEMRHRLRAALQPLGLWQEATFGLWAVLGCDC